MAIASSTSRRIDKRCGSRRPPLTNRQREQINKLLTENAGLVGSAIQRWGLKLLPREGFDELFMIGQEAMFRAAQSFDPQRGFKFSTYAMNAIFRAFVREKQDSIRTKRRMLVQRDETDWERLSDTRPAPEEPMEEDQLQRLKLAIAALKEDQREIIQRRFFGQETLEDIGRDKHINKERVRQIQLAALNELEKILGDGEARTCKRPKLHVGALTGRSRRGIRPVSAPVRQSA